MTSCIAQVLAAFMHLSQALSTNTVPKKVLLPSVVRGPSSVYLVGWANHGSPCSVRGQQWGWCVCEAHECLLSSGHRRLPELLQVNMNPTVKSCTSLESSIDVYCTATIANVRVGINWIFPSASSVFQGELSEAIPVVHASIGGCRIVGRLCVGKTLLAYFGVARLLDQLYMMDQVLDEIQKLYCTDAVSLNIAMVWTWPSDMQLDCGSGLGLRLGRLISFTDTFITWLVCQIWLTPFVDISSLSYSLLVD